MSATTVFADPVTQPAPQPGWTIGLVNNADARAMKATARQFRAMLESALPGTFTLKLYRPAALMAGGASGDPSSARYLPLADLLDAEAPGEVVDAVLVTGMQPLAARLQDEPVWPQLAQLAEWAERRAVPMLWSCLAAHAAMLYLDDVDRVRLPAKLSGLYACEAAEAGHTLLCGLPSRWITPHSRYNAVSEDRLAAHGYTVLSRSAKAGADTLLRRSAALSLFLQGHPEYDRDTLLKEYRRDTNQYFSGATNEIPVVPADYFDPGAAEALTTLRERLLRYGRVPSVKSQMLALIEGASYRSANPSIGQRLVANWLRAACLLDGVVASSSARHQAAMWGP